MDAVPSEQVLATYGGTAIRPGVSRNRRLYSREVLAKMVARAQERLADPEGMPLTMLTHHAAGDDSLRIVGRVTSLALDEDGSVRYSAELVNNEKGREILPLIEKDEAGRQFLRGVSIRGAWLGPVRSEPGPDGAPVAVADDLELDGLDFTATPGVPGATVDTVQRTGPGDGPTETTSEGRVLVYESVQEALVEDTDPDEEMPVTTSSPAAETAAPERVVYADNGYRDSSKRYPLGTAPETATAFLDFTQESVASGYTPPQLKRIRQRIGKALESHQLTAAEGGVLVSPVTESAEVTEFFDYDGDGSFCVHLTNGPVTVKVSSWCVDTKDLPQIGMAAMNGAVAALQLLDPDLDGDIDVPGASDADDPDGDAPAESAAAGDAVTELDASQTPAADGATGTQTVTDPAADPEPEGEPAMSEPTAPEAGAQAAPSITLTGDQFQALLARFAPAAAPEAPAESAPVPAAAATETAAPAAAPVETPAAAPAVQETEDQRIARLVEEKLTAAIQTHAQSGGLPTRKGLVPSTTAAAGAVAESAPDGELPAEWPQKPLHEYTDAERSRYLRPQIEAAIMGPRSIYRQD